MEPCGIEAPCLFRILIGGLCAHTFLVLLTLYFKSKRIDPQGSSLLAGAFISRVHDEVVCPPPSAAPQHPRPPSACSQSLCSWASCTPSWGPKAQRGSGSTLPLNVRATLASSSPRVLPTVCALPGWAETRGPSPPGAAHKARKDMSTPTRPASPAVSLALALRGRQSATEHAH